MKLLKYAWTWSSNEATQNEFKAAENEAAHYIIQYSDGIRSIHYNTLMIQFEILNLKS